MSSDSHRRILAVVRRIPHGRVATYGQVAELAGLPGQARLVGYALSALAPTTAVPWHRVVNARGVISLSGSAAVTQRLRLSGEGVVVSDAGTLDLTLHRWAPRARRSQRAGKLTPRTGGPR